MPRERGGLHRIAVLLACGALVLGLWRLVSPPSGPVEPAWDRVACARCHMLVSDPRFAVQLHTHAGEVLFYDDPGCALLARAEAGKAPAALYFHDFEGASWLAERDVRFVPVPETPMGHGFAALAAGAKADAIDAAALLAQLEQRAKGSP
jgi:hypothetical protein